MALVKPNWIETYLKDTLKPQDVMLVFSFSCLYFWPEVLECEGGPNDAQERRMDRFLQLGRKLKNPINKLLFLQQDSYCNENFALRLWWNICFTINLVLISWNFKMSIVTFNGLVTLSIVQPWPLWRLFKWLKLKRILRKNFKYDRCCICKQSTRTWVQFKLHSIVCFFSHNDSPIKNCSVSAH